MMGLWVEIVAYLVLNPIGFAICMVIILLLIKLLF